MILPFSVSETFKYNKDFTITSFDGNVLIVDDFYLNFEKIQEVIYNMPVPMWKWHEMGRNFKDYFDCRPTISFQFHEEQIKENINVIFNLCRKFFPSKKRFILNNHPLEFNYFKHIKKNVDKNFQQYPHVDYYLNCIIYMDKESSGGTAIYDMEREDNFEDLNLMFDATDVPFKLVEAKPNRLAIFSGLKPHGGYIANHKVYEDNWRINQVIFVEEDNG